MRAGTLRALLCAVLTCTPGLIFAQTSNTEQLQTSSLEDLTQMKVSVSSFARRSEDLEKTPGAVYVITSQQIERSAATSIPDLLRMVPGVQVAQINSYTWAVTARGFNNQFADKLLVMVDGRTIYSEVFYGVNWDEIDLPLGTIERIEIVRGPGAAVWGTNAVNGVINIITKPVLHAIGARASSRVSNLIQRLNLQYAGTLTERSQYSLNLTGIHRRAFVDAQGNPAFDGETSERIGGRIDWQPTLRDSVNVSGDLYRGTNHADLLLPPASGIGERDRAGMSGGFLLGRWEHRKASSETVLQAYIARQSRYELGNEGKTNTADLDLQHHFHAGANHDIVVGGEARLTSDVSRGAPRITLLPEYDNYLVSAFVQDEITLAPNKFFATVGTKVQEGSLAGFQIQPSVRLLWTPVSGQVFWGAASHAAVATPVAEVGIDFDEIFGTINGLPIIVLLDGNPAIKPEFVDAFEAGYRTHLGRALSMDFAGFYNVNTRLVSVLSGVPEPSLEYAPSFGIPATFVNGYRAKSQGFEAALSWKPSKSLDLTGSYTWMQAHGRQTYPGFVGILESWSSPRNSGSLSASWAFAPGWRMNSFLQYVQKLSDTSPFFHGSTPGQEVGGYARFDLHVTHPVGRHLDLDAGGTNLFSPRHPEFGDNSGTVHCFEVPRSWFAKATVRF